MIELKEGDWIVHREFGAGQVGKLVELKLGGEPRKYHKLKTSGADLWLPLDNCTSEWLRPLIDPSEFKKALKEISKPPADLPDNAATRKIYLAETTALSSPVEIGKVLRDLNGWRKQTNGLSGNELTVWKQFRTIFLAEWQATTGITLADAEKKLLALLEKSRPSDRS